MIIRMKLSLCLMLALAAGGCADPSAKSPSGIEDISASEADASAEESASSAQPASPELSPGSAEGSTPSVQTEFDRDGLSIGPGSGFVVLDNPAVIPGEQATWLAPDELILGVIVGDKARAYPISQMAYHHIANDQIGREPYLVTYAQFKSALPVSVPR